jgi:hypothetical protein
VRRDEIERLREELLGKEQVIELLAEQLAGLDVQQGRLEMLLEEREDIVMKSAAEEVHRLRESLADITTWKDRLLRDAQKHGPGPPWAVKRPNVSHGELDLLGTLYGRAGCLAAQNNDFGPGRGGDGAADQAV